MTAAPAARDEGLVRAIGTRALAAGIFNLMVGAGIFVLPAAVAGQLGSAAILAYAVCGVVVGLVMLCFAESGSRVSRTGGLYAYVETALGPFVGFLTGTLLWFAAGMLASAAVANAFVGTLAELAPAIGRGVPRVILLLLVYGGLAAGNIRGVRVGSRLVEGMTVAKLTPLLLLVVAGVFAIQPSNLGLGTLPSISQIGNAALVLFFAFAGSEVALTPSGEITRPTRTVPRALVIALLAVTALYISVHIVAQGVLGSSLAENQQAPLAAAASVVLGQGGRVIVLAGAAISTLGYLSGDMLASPRMLFAFGRDGRLPEAFAGIHPRFRTPVLAIVAHAAVTFGFAVSGTFTRLVVLANVGMLAAYLFCIIATAVLHYRDVRVEGGDPPFRLPGGPAVPLVAALIVVWLLSHATAPEYRATGISLVVAALVYGASRVRSRG